MTQNLRLRIIVLLSRNLNRLYSISEISKLLKSAYSHSNKFVLELQKENIVKITKIANAHICTLNLNEQLTLAYLSMIEYQNAKKWGSKNKQKVAKINLFISRIRDKKIPVDSILVTKSDVIIIVNEINSALSKMIDNENLGIGYVVIDRHKFAEMQNDIVGEHVIFYGAEKFWEMVKKEVKIE